MQALRVVKYALKPEYARFTGLSSDEANTGVIAQEVQKVIPDAVKPAGDLIFPDGKRIPNFLVVNKVKLAAYNGIFLIYYMK